MKDMVEFERDFERLKRRLQHMCCKLHLFILLDIIKIRTGCFSVDVAHIE